MKSYLQSSLYLGFLLIAVDILIYMMDYRAGLVLSGFIVFYIAIILSMMLYNKPIHSWELAGIMLSMKSKDSNVRCSADQKDRSAEESHLGFVKERKEGIWWRKL